VRILQVHNRHRQQGGEDEVVAFERALLTRAGHQVIPFVTDNPTGNLGAGRAALGAPWNPRAARRVVEAARRAGADVAHVHNTWLTPSAAVLPALADAGFPVVVTLHNFRSVCANGLLLRDGRSCHDCVGTHPLPAVVHRCYRGSFALSGLAAAAVVATRRLGAWDRVGRVLVLDPAAVDPVVAGGLARDRVVVAPNAVPDPPPRALPPSASDTVVFAGRLSVEKGAEVAVAAWRRGAPPGLRLVVLGDGPGASGLAAAAGPGVTLAGRIDQPAVLRALASARALLAPSLCLEPGPLAPLHAAAAGVPLVVSDAMALAERVGAAGAGWVAPAGDAEGTARVLARLGDDGGVDRAGAAARSLYLHGHRPDAALARLLETYEAVVAEGPRS
jgi:glycosyltransferase involved in cell wall biosynthesis